MTGLEKMISQIVDEATESAREMTAQAEAEAAKIAQAAEADVQKQKEELSKKSQADTEAYMERIKSSADLQRRTAILRAKQDVIAQVLEKAYASFAVLLCRAWTRMRTLICSAKCCGNLCSRKRAKSTFRQRIWSGCQRASRQISTPSPRKRAVH